MESKSADKILISHGNGIIIQDHEKKHMITCYSVKASKVLFTGKNEPKYALTGSESSSFWKPNDIILGWYKDLESVQLEIDRIMAAMENKESTYKLIHNSKVKMSGFFGQPKLVSEK